MADYFGDEFLRAGRANETVVVRDTAHDERANAEAYARLKIGSFISVPFQRNGRWTANITVTTREPRDRRAAEIGLLQEIINRVFPRIERARAEDAPRSREGRYRELVEAQKRFVNDAAHELRAPTTAVQGNGWAQLRVSDTGIGIAPEELGQVFERFYRSDKARLRGEDPGGTGLGLGIAKQIVEAHDGEIWLESKLGKGTTAVVRLPLRKGPNRDS
ncbi:MAG: hypothetical protein C4331_12805 [Meiothermus sp.]